MIDKSNDKLINFFQKRFGFKVITDDNTNNNNNNNNDNNNESKNPDLIKLKLEIQLVRQTLHYLNKKGNSKKSSPNKNN